jgi:hypothetical protein
MSGYKVLEMRAIAIALGRVTCRRGVAGDVTPVGNFASRARETAWLVRLAPRHAGCSARGGELSWFEGSSIVTGPSDNGEIALAAQCAIVSRVPGFARLRVGAGS